ncbi:MAG: S8 family serine peptidase, partial [Kineosporiaceae bacterium]
MEHATVLPAAPTSTADDAGPAEPVGSLRLVSAQIGAADLHEGRITGAGVTVAVVDTGIAPVAALGDHDKIAALVDLTPEATMPSLRHRDGFGHGTHMAGIVAGRGCDGVDDGFAGIAPGAGLVSVKVGDRHGAVDVSQVIDAIGWVVAHREELGIRVLSLSYGTDADQPYEVDPLAAAVERAWQAGIVVVVAAGNAGPDASRLDNPASDPFVIAVGGAELGTDGWVPLADTSAGDGVRNPDIAAPGRSIESLRAPGSRADRLHPEGYVDDLRFKGTGSSQAAAVVAGAVALLLEARPSLTPDEVKSLLRTTARPLGHEQRLGRGLVDVAAAVVAPVPPDSLQTWAPSDGSGSLEAARGSRHVIVDGEVLVGEFTSTPTGSARTAWSAPPLNGVSWNGVSWNGVSWNGVSWNGVSWNGVSWNGVSW